jgi:hypothetical protein
LATNALSSNIATWINLNLTLRMESF